MERELNGDLNKFFTEKVQMKREVTQKAIAKVEPILNQLLCEMNRMDQRIPKKLDGDARVGSYYAGLKIKQADEFDFSVPIQGPYGKGMWTSDEPRLFQFNRDIDDKFDTLPDNVQVTRSNSPLPPPETGFMAVRHQTVAQHWRQMGGISLTFQDYIIPYMVKLWFKVILKKAIDKLGLKVKDGK